MAQELQLMTSKTSALHFNEPLPGSWYCACWTTGIAYWDFYRTEP